MSVEGGVGVIEGVSFEVLHPVTVAPKFDTMLLRCNIFLTLVASASEDWYHGAASGLPSSCDAFCSKLGGTCNLAELQHAASSAAGVEGAAAAAGEPCTSTAETISGNAANPRRGYFGKPVGICHYGTTIGVTCNAEVPNTPDVRLCYCDDPPPPPPYQDLIKDIILEIREAIRDFIFSLIGCS